MLERAGGPTATPGPPGGGGPRGLPFNLPVPPPASGQSMAGAHRALAAFHPRAGRSKRISAFGKADRGSAAKAARIQAIACPRRKEHPPGRIPSSRAAGFRRLKGSDRGLQESARGDPGATVRGPRTAEPRIRAKAVESDLCRAQEC